MKTWISIAIFIAATATADAQLHIQSNTVFKTTGGVQVVLNNIDITNNSANADFSNAVLILKGTSNTTIGGTGNWNVKQLKIDKGSGTSLLATPIQVSEKVQFVSGKLDLNNQTLTLGSNAYLQDETESSRVVGPNGGQVQITKTLNAPSAVNAGNLGAVITSSVNLGTVTIKRLHKTANESGSGKVKRFYEITPTTNSSLNATLRLHYFDAELNGVSESALTILKRTSSNASWTQLGASTRNSSSNYVEKTGVGSLFQYALAATAPSLTATQKTITEVREAVSLSATLAPVPAQTFSILTISTPVSGRAEVRLIAADGKAVLQSSKEVVTGVNTLSLDVSRLAGGTYYVQVGLPGGVTKTLTLVKQ